MDTSLSHIGHQIGVHFFQPTSVKENQVFKEWAEAKLPV